jgi:hypothetical protein
LPYNIGCRGVFLISSWFIDEYLFDKYILDGDILNGSKERNFDAHIFELS